MNITSNKVAIIHYAVSDSEDTLIDSSYDHQPLAVIHGTGYLIPGLESALEGHEAGDKFTVTVAPENGYGERYDDYVQTVPKEMFAEIDDLQIGAQLRATTDDGEQTVIVVDMDDDSITVDGNHPLAGIELKFEVEVLEVRDATAEELEHGHVHTKSSCCDDDDCEKKS